ncbi:MAG: DinB family protein [Pirellulaceae bacterium]
MNLQLDVAVKQIEFARTYTLELISDVAPDDWFRMPEGATSHIGWQVAHLAIAEYGLCLFRQRDRRPEDAELMTGRYRKAYGKGSTPDPNPENNTPPDEILATLERVHRQALAEMAEIPDAQLAEPVDMPYAGYPTKLGALLFCSHHEFLHAGQIGLLRRLLGKSPLR